MPSSNAIAVALSGGVDSCVAAFLLKQQGFEVIGVHMTLFPESADSSSLVQEIDGFCRTIGIEWRLFDFKEEFERKVINYFCSEYAVGRTPNPCVMCNRHIKFGILFDKLSEYGISKLATGHYAKVEFRGNKYHLLRGKDAKKDQSYVLHKLDQSRLANIVFPLGDMVKTEVLEIAKKEGFISAKKKSSQDICFIDGKYPVFLENRLPETKGDIVTESGEIIGSHEGLYRYTIGQRCGITIDPNECLYVSKIDHSSNRVIAAKQESLYRNELEAEEINWLQGNTPDAPFEALIKIRYKAEAVIGTIFPLKHKVKIRFNQAQRAISPGQSVVFYRQDEVLGGGTIES